MTLRTRFSAMQSGNPYAEFMKELTPCLDTVEDWNLDLKAGDTLFIAADKVDFDIVAFHMAGLVKDLAKNNRESDLDILLTYIETRTAREGFIGAIIAADFAATISVYNYGYDAYYAVHYLTQARQQFDEAAPVTKLSMLESVMELGNTDEEWLPCSSLLPEALQNFVLDGYDKIRAQADGDEVLVGRLNKLGLNLNDTFTSDRLPVIVPETRTSQRELNLA